MPRKLVFLIVIGIFFLSASLSGGSVGASSACVNNECKVVVASSIASLLLGISLGLFIFYFPRKHSITDSSNIVGLWRRFGAFFLDFMTVLIVISPIAVVPILIAEANFTSEFTWSFERDFVRPTDDIYLLPGVFGIFIALYLYFLLYARSNIQTVGQYILGYKVKAIDENDNSPQYAKRVLFSFWGLCAWPISVILALRTPKKACWWDAITNTEVVRTMVVNKELQPTIESGG
ncbi:MAG: RDD family protein [Gammaproteobacteria bacterium]|nr:RDD family protein [Gammaproteobacteria bacterium]MDH5594947.1 RDD family protein [Gammaproteobacteria bacterium]